MDTKRFDEKNLAKHKERCDMIEQLAIAEEENRKLGIRADKLEQRLESETRKAERRMRHIDLMGAALTERRNQLHERGERIAELEKQVADLRAELEDTNRMLRESDQLGERERAILDMWPRFEDGEPVMIGDEVDGLGGEIVEVYITENEAAIWNSSANHMHLSPGERVKRPAPKVLDADGVEIKVGDTVWTLDGLEGVVTKVEDGAACIAYESDYAQREEADNLTHARPDSWERLEEDLKKSTCDYFGFAPLSCGAGEGCPAYEKSSCKDFMALDIIRRAKALAGAEVGE